MLGERAPDPKELPLHLAPHVRTVDDAAAFLEAAAPLLLRDEARHNLMLGIVGRIASEPGSYPLFRLWLAEDELGTVVGAASMTPPWPIVLARPAHDAVIAALVASASHDDLPVPGVEGAVPEAHDFASPWAAATDVSHCVSAATGSATIEMTARRMRPSPPPTRASSIAMRRTKKLAPHRMTATGIA
jgi:hypothetical protein